MTMTLKEMFDKSRDYWGLASQLTMLAEECSELSVSALHMARKNKYETMDHFAEEIADVEFLIDEMKYYFQLVPLIIKHRKLKEKKLEKLLTPKNTA